MNDYRISETARATGFSVSALRFYEKEGVVVPERMETGYRSYRDEDIAALEFVRRAKGFGLTLPEIRELLTLMENDECRPVQARVHQLVADRIDEAQQQIADLVALTAQLKQTAAYLGSHTPEGACDDLCGCRTIPPAAETRSLPVPLAASTSPEIACSLEPHLILGRTEDWKAMASQAQTRDQLADGIRLGFHRDIDVAALSRLAVDEQDCCGFFTFTIGIRADAITLDITGPADAQPVLAIMFGAAA